MKKLDGTSDSVVFLADGTAIKPDATGTIQVPASHYLSLVSAGYAMQVTGGTTHIP
jgi:hypothetical protein